MKWSIAMIYSIGGVFYNSYSQYRDTLVKKESEAREEALGIRKYDRITLTPTAILEENASFQKKLRKSVIHRITNPIQL